MRISAVRLRETRCPKVAHRLRHESLPIEEADKARLLEMRHESYIGIAAQLAKKV
jgi:hypothetical protein